MAISHAPWSEEQVENLALRQEGPLHPYTHSHGLDSIELVPTRDGWVCGGTDCQYTQDWAHEVDVEYRSWWKDFSIKVKEDSE